MQPTTDKLQINETNTEVAPKEVHWMEEYVQWLKEGILNTQLG